MATASAVVVSAPMAFYVGSAPAHWLDGAWPVSAILVGFDLSLIIFLLQLAASQNVRSEATFRALLISSRVVWPVTFSLVFIAWTAGIEFSAGGHAAAPSSFANAWVLAYFLAQIALFGLVFVRAFALVSPAGVGRVMQTAQADLIRRSVESRLRHKYADAVFAAAEKRANLAVGLTLSGQRVLLERKGTVWDLDTHLPVAIAEYGLAAQTQLMVGVGYEVGPESVIARVTGLLAPWRARELRAGIYVRRRPPVIRDWVSIFKEAVDLARRAVAEHTDAQGPLDIIVAGLAELPRAYAHYGLTYTAISVRDVFGFTAEDEVVRELFAFSRDVFASDSVAAVQLMPSLGYRVVRTGLDEHAPLLVSWGFTLWRYQVGIARTIISKPDVGEGVITAVSELAQWVAQSLASLVEDETLPLSARREAGERLIDAFRFETRLLKSHIDAGDEEAFVGGWERAASWGQYWQPQSAVDEARMWVSVAAGDSQAREAQASLQRAEASLAMRDDLAAERDWGTFMLGAWLLQRYQQGEVKEEVWTRLYPYLLGPFDGGAQGLSAAVADMHLQGRVAELDEWEVEAMEIRGPTTITRSPVTASALRWAVLLLLHRTAPGKQPEVAFREPVEHVAPTLLEHVSDFGAEAARWETIVGGQLAERAAALRAAIEDAVVAEKRRAEERVASAPLSEDRLTKYVTAQRAAFVESNGLRRLLAAAGALSVEPRDDDAPVGSKVSMFIDKRVFLDDVPFVMSWGGVGAQMAAREQYEIFKVLSEVATPAPAGTDVAAAAATAIAQLRGNGFTPDVVLIPRDFGTRRLLARHSAFRRSTQPPSTERIEIGFLEEVPVVELQARGLRALVVADLGKAVRLVERREADDASPLRVEVSPIDEARVRELVANGFKVDGEESEQTIETFPRTKAEVFIDLNYSAAGVPDSKRAAICVELPPDTAEAVEIAPG